jgi:hypothetical protein
MVDPRSVTHSGHPWDSARYDARDGALNECAEYQRLQLAYAAAIILWEEDRHPGVQPINRGRRTTEEAEELRNQALLKRNIAANELFIHLKTCPICKNLRK